jgi:hypothetical protein
MNENGKKENLNVMKTSFLNEEDTQEESYTIRPMLQHTRNIRLWSLTSKQNAIGSMA